MDGFTLVLSLFLFSHFYPLQSQAESFAYRPEATTFYRAHLSHTENLRFLKAGVLEVAVNAPEGTTLLIPKDIAPSKQNYRAEDGSVESSSNLFFSSITIESVSGADAPNFPQAKIDALNATPGGLYVTSLISDDFEDPQIYPLVPKSASTGYLSSYLENGKPLFTYTSSFQRRFPGRLNRVIDPTTMDPVVLKKSKAIMAELAKVANRTVATSPTLLFMATQKAEEASRAFEQSGVVSPLGAWSVAVLGTAERHGFANVPCAEFQSELIRQAYKRAGYSHFEDFNAKNDNPLFWDNTAAVEELANALDRAGWVPWETAFFKPMIGAPVMHYLATTPGHAYMAAGMNGRWIIDNGFPRGLDLGSLTDRTIVNQYRSGVFFLPPGILPEKW
jgi:hypothetical protein